MQTDLRDSVVFFPTHIETCFPNSEGRLGSSEPRVGRYKARKWHVRRIGVKNRMSSGISEENYKSIVSSREISTPSFPRWKIRSYIFRRRYINRTHYALRPDISPLYITEYALTLRPYITRDRRQDCLITPDWLFGTFSAKLLPSLRKDHSHFGIVETCNMPEARNTFSPYPYVRPAHQAQTKNYRSLMFRILTTLGSCGYAPKYLLKQYTLAGREIDKQRFPIFKDTTAPAPYQMKCSSSVCLIS